MDLGCKGRESCITDLVDPASCPFPLVILLLEEEEDSSQAHDMSDKKELTGLSLQTPLAVAGLLQWKCTVFN